MSRKSLQCHLANHYERQSMSSQRLTAMVSMINREAGMQDASGGVLRGPWRRVVPLALAAMLLLTVGIGLWQSTKTADAMVVTQRVCEEIIDKHNRNRDLKIVAADFDTIAAAMTGSTFKPHSPVKLEGMGLKLIGARYCSIQGCAAIEFRLVDEQGRHYTLYQAKVDNTLKDVREATIAIDKVKVEVWREGDMIMGLASPTL